MIDGSLLLYCCDVSFIVVIFHILIHAPQSTCGCSKTHNIYCVCLRCEWMAAKRPRDDADLQNITDNVMFTSDSDDDESHRPTSALLIRPASSRTHAFQPSACADEVKHCAQPKAHQQDDVEDQSILHQRLASLLVDSPTAFKGGSREDTSPIMSYLLRTYCSMADGILRAGQEEVVRRILRRESVIALFPTGWGKSLCYQLPMLVHRLLNASVKLREQAREAERPSDAQQKFAVVVSPLLALISDQISSIRRQDAVCAVSISSTTGRDAEQKILSSLCDASGNDIDVVFVSPEAFVTKHRLRMVLKQCLSRIAFVCIDEAHCISSWSHDFRPTYLYLKKSLEDLHRQAQLGGAGSSVSEHTTPVCTPPILALTATASSSVINEVAMLLGIEHVVNRMHPRSNIRLESVKLAANANAALGVDRTKEMRAHLLQAVCEMEAPMLIYAQTQVQVDELYGFLRHELSISWNQQHGQEEPTRRIAAYHAGLPLSQRTAAQRMFLSDDVHILIATVAFGMGINKSNIRSVVHYCCPSSLAAYSQETGRAGRDGLPACCRIIFDVDEFFLLRRKALCHLMSFMDVKKITSRLLSSNHVATFGPHKTLAVSTEQIAGEVGCSSATVETLMYLILNSHSRVLLALDGKTPLSFRVLASSESTTADDDTSPAAPSISDASTHIRGWVHQRSHDQSRRYNASLQGFLTQLGVECPVEQLCRSSVKSLIPSVVHAANSTNLPLDDFLMRLKSIEDSRLYKLRWSNYGFLIHCGPAFPPCEEMVNLISKEMFQKLKRRMTASVAHLHDMFHFLESPSQDALVHALCGRQEETNGGDPTEPARWSPPAPRLSRLQAVEIANQFVAENRERILSSTEAVKALMGIAPMFGGSAPTSSGGLAPLTGSWYLRHPHFASLQEFDQDWLTKVVSAHALPI